MPVSDTLAAVRLLALDVDGTLTDGGVYFDDAGGELKRFHIHDGLGIVLAGLAGLPVAWITGRTSPIVERRARELKVPYLRMGVRDKTAVLEQIALAANVPLHAVAFMGDDLNDVDALRSAGVALAPANAVEYVQSLAHWVAARSGGEGAVRDAIDAILQARGDYEATLSTYLKSLTEYTAQNPVQ